MPTLNDPAARAALIARLDRLSPEAAARWGTMTAPRMLAHMTDVLRMALGELPVRQKRIPLIGSFPFKQLVIYVLPFPRNAPTAPEAVARTPDAFDVERASIETLLERMAGNVTYAAHPVFGTMTRSEWGALGYRHFDHHLRQFGV